MRPVSHALLSLAALSVSSIATAAPPAKVRICHAAGGGTVLIDVNGSAVSAHLAHGDAESGAFFQDTDGDGFGDAGAAPSPCPAPGWVANAEDCDDDDAFAYPGAPETCDGADDDCDGTADEPDAIDAAVWYADHDGDGWGDAAQALASCDSPEGYAADGSDCDDARASVHPGATETCDETDEDCNGIVDDGVSGAWYPDVDGDGYGDSFADAASCPIDGSVTDDTDCDDADGFVYPGAPETCDDVDEDCDGEVDEGMSGDGFGSAADAPELTRAGPASVATAYGIRAAGGGDFNGDGYDDFVVVGYGGPGIVEAFYGDASGVGPEPDRTYLGDATVRHFGQDVDVGDLNADGFADLVIGAADQSHAIGGAVRVYLGSAAGLPSTHDLEIRALSSAEEYGWAVAVADVDGDGIGDLVVGSRSRRCVYTGVAHGLPSTSGACANEQASYFLVGDYDGDGYDDLAYMNTYATISTVIAMGGPAGLGASTLHSAGWFVGENPSRSADYTGDGIDDLVITNYSSTRLFAGSASGVSAAPSWSGLGSADIAHVGDATGDGLPDLALVASGQLRVYSGTATGLASTPLPLAWGSDLSTVAQTGDVDGDGDDEVLAAAYRFDGQHGIANLFEGGAGECMP